jgi:hypothetical protein
MQLLRRRKQSDAYGGAVRGIGGASLGTCGWVAQWSVKLCADAEGLCEQNVPKKVQMLMGRQPGNIRNKTTVGADGRATQ